MIEEYQVEQVHGAWINGPMKWIFLILGPNHHAKDIRNVLSNEYQNLNIIVVLVTNTNAHKVTIINNSHDHDTDKSDPIEGGAGPAGNLLEKSASQKTGKSVHSGSQKQGTSKSGDPGTGSNKSGTYKSGSRSQANSKSKSASQTRVEDQHSHEHDHSHAKKRSHSSHEFHHASTKSLFNQEIDSVTNNLNRLCRLTPEGYMILIDQRQFEGREAGLNFDKEETIQEKSIANTTLSSSISGPKDKQYGLAIDVEKIFSKIC